MKIQLKARNRAHQFDAAPDDKVLSAGLAQAVGLPYECGSGTCGTCRAKLLAGEIDDAWPDAPGRKSCKGPDEFLMCQCSAKTDLAIEVTGFVEPMEPATCVPRHVLGRIVRCDRLTHDVVELAVALSQPMDFDAGQYVLLQVPGIPGARGWSMVNWAKGATTLVFCVKKKPGGHVSEWLFNGERTGAEVRVFGPLGKATWYPDIARALLCIAGGSGIAGMMSILDRAVGAGHFERHDGDVFFGVRTRRDAFYLDRFSVLADRAGPRLKVTVALSEDEADAALRRQHPLLQFDTGFVHEVAKQRMAGRFAGVRAYLAGPPPAVDAAVRLLLMSRVPSADIRYDKFS